MAVTLVVKEKLAKYTRDIKANDVIRFPPGVRFTAVDLPEISMQPVLGYSILTTHGGQIYDTNGWVRLRSTP